MHKKPKINSQSVRIIIMGIMMRFFHQPNAKKYLHTRTRQADVYMLAFEMEGKILGK